MPVRIFRPLLFLTVLAALGWSAPARADFSCSNGKAICYSGRDLREKECADAGQQAYCVKMKEEADRKAAELEASGATGTEIEAAQNGGNLANISDSAAKVGGFCDLPANVKDYKDPFLRFCWYCAPFTNFLEIIPSVAASTFAALKGPLNSILATGFLVWLAFHTFVKLGTNFFKGGSIGEEYYSQMIAGVFRVIVAAALLNAGIEWLWEYTVNIVGSIGLSVAGAIVGVAEGVAEDVDTGTFGEDSPPSTGGSCSYSYSPSGESFGFGYIIDQIAGILKAFNCTLMNLLADGVLLFKYAFIETGSTGGCTWPTLSTLLAGLALIFFACLLLIRAPLKLVDAMFQLVVCAALLPVGVVCWVFPSTRKYTSNIFNLLLGALGLFITMGIMLAIVSQVLTHVISIGGDRNDVVEWAGQFSWDVFTEGQPNIFMALGVMWLCYQGFGTVGELNGKLFSNVLNVGGGKTGDRTANMAISAATSAPGIIGTAAGVAGTGLLGTGRGIWNRLRAPPQPSAPAPPTRAYRDERRSSGKAASRIAREEARQGRPLNAKERLDIQQDEARLLLAANKRLRDRKSGVNDAQAEAIRGNTLIKSREARLGRKLTADEQQKVMDDVDAMSKRHGKTDTDMNYRARYKEHYEKDKEQWQDDGHGFSTPDTSPEANTSGIPDANSTQ
jgi:hypothetical protein